LCQSQEQPPLNLHLSSAHCQLCVSQRYYRNIVAGIRLPDQERFLRLLTDPTVGLGITDVSSVERILKRYGRSLTQEQKHKYLGRLSPKWLGLVAWYPLTGSSADKSGTNNHGIPSGVQFVWDGAVDVGSFEGSGHIVVRD